MYVYAHVHTHTHARRMQVTYVQDSHEPDSLNAVLKHSWVLHISSSKVGLKTDTHKSRICGFRGGQHAGK